MIIPIDGVPVYFPYPQIYPEQLRYIRAVITAAKTPGHILIEMPSGTGKTIALLSSTISYLIHARTRKQPFKIIYCTRTVQEIDKTLKEMRVLVNYIQKHVDFEFLGFGLTQRLNMCVNEEALKSGNVELTCNKMINRLENSHCDFYENYDFTFPPGVYDFESMRDLGREHGVCPYFLARRSISLCDCIVYTYKYLVDPRIYTCVSSVLPDDSFVIFDEAHNIDAHCIEALSMNLDRNILESAGRALTSLAGIVVGKDADVDKNKVQSAAPEDTIPYFYTERKFRLLPGSIRKPEHFVRMIRRLIEFFKTKLKTSHMVTESIDTFVGSISELAYISPDLLKFASYRLGQLLRRFSFEHSDLESLKYVSEFATMLGVYSKGFSVIFEPFDSMAAAYNPILRLYCADASIAISQVFEKFRNVLITSGTLSPIEMYPKLLNFVPAHVHVLGAALHKNLISPIIVTKGNDQMLLKSKDDFENEDALPEILTPNEKKSEMGTAFRMRRDPSVTRNYGRLLVSLAQAVPDNIVCFFPSYIYMEDVISTWSETGIIKEILEYKLVFVETPDHRETEMALRCFKQACDTGRGAILLSVARGKVAEGIDFEDGYGRAVVMIGVPFMYTESVRIRERLSYLKKEFGINGYDFLTFDAMRHAAQCLGRGLRNKFDYGLMVLADYRFGMSGKIEKLPLWIRERLEKGHTGLSIDMAVSIARTFFKEMAQKDDDVQECLLSEEGALRFLNEIE